MLHPFRSSLVACAALAWALGCVRPDYSLPTTPLPGGEGTAGSPVIRTLPLPRPQVFPKVVAVLLDMGYQVRSANAELGLVSLSRTWFDDTLLARPEMSVDATLLFQADGPDRTRVLMLPTGRWSLVSARGKDSGSATVMGAQPALAEKDVSPFLDELARRLAASSPATR